MTSATTVLVPFEGPAHIYATLPVARGLARLKGATAVLIRVGPEPLAPDQFFESIRLTPQDMRGMVIEQPLGLPAKSIVQEAEARHSDLIVMRSPTWLGDPSHPFQTVAGDVLRAAPCPVILVPLIAGGQPWALRRLLLPHDGTPTSAAAIAPAADLVARAGAELVVLHVATPGADRPDEAGTIIAPRYLDQPHHEWPAWAGEFLGRAQAHGHPTKVEKIRLALMHGHPDSAVLEFARVNATDLIALAWRGGAESERARTMRRIIREANCPVIIFRVQR